VRREAVPLLGFAALSAVFDGLLWTFQPTLLAGLLLALPPVVTAAAGIGAALAPAPSDRRVVPERSFATVLVSIGCFVAAAGVIFGLWLFLIGAGLALIGAAWLARELRAARRRAHD
jgi:hypothetical protein